MKLLCTLSLAALVTGMPTLAQDAAPPAAGALEPGLLAEVFDLGAAVENFPELAADKAATVTKIDAEINVESLGEAGKWPGTELAANFYIRWTGMLKIEKAGKYKLYTISDDGSRVFLDGKAVVDNSGLHGMQEKGSEELELTTGTHEIKIELFQGGGGAGCRLLWETEGVEKQTVPATALGHKPAAAK